MGKAAGQRRADAARSTATSAIDDREHAQFGFIARGDKLGIQQPLVQVVLLASLLQLLVMGNCRQDARFQLPAVGHHKGRPRRGANDLPDGMRQLERTAA